MKLKFWKDIDEEKKDRIVFISGLVVAVFVALVLIASLSYIFTWKADGSLLNDAGMMARGVDVQNAGG